MAVGVRHGRLWNLRSSGNVPALMQEKVQHACQCEDGDCCGGEYRCMGVTGFSAMPSHDD